LADRILQPDLVSEEHPRILGAHFQMRAQNGHAETGRNGKTHDVERIGRAHQDEPAVEAGGGIVGVARSRDHPLALECRGEKLGISERKLQNVGNRECGGHGGRGATPHAAREGKSLSKLESNPERSSPRIALEDLLRGDGRGVLVGLAREAPLVAVDSGDDETGLIRELHRHRIARLLERETEHVEPASHVGDGRGSECGRPWAARHHPLGLSPGPPARTTGVL